MTTSITSAIVGRGAASALLREDVVFHSPVLHRPTEGRDAVSFLLGLVWQLRLWGK